MTKRILSVLSAVSLVAMLAPLSVRTGAAEITCRVPFGFSLDGTKPDGDVGAYWRQVHPLYVEQFGPEASAIGPPAGHA